MQVLNSLEEHLETKHHMGKTLHQKSLRSQPETSSQALDCMKITDKVIKVNCLLVEFIAKLHTHSYYRHTIHCERVNTGVA